jgi:xanthine dehydrogenase accessory factor
MRDVLRALVDAIAQQRPVVYCRLVETRGSTPQKAGAAMLVYADGSQAGTLGGGCVEAEVKRRALAVAASGGGPEILLFQLDSDYGWDDGLICGGRMQVLVDPLREPATADYFQRLYRQVEQGDGCTEAIVLDASRCGLPQAATWLLDAQGRLLAAQRLPSRDAEPPANVVHHLQSLAVRPRPYVAQGIAYLPVLPRCRLLIVGGGHVGQAVGQLAVELDFDVWVVDDREEYVTRERFPRAQRLICGPIGPTLRQLEITPQTYCLIVTRGHNHDEEALYHLVNRNARYVGMIGSKRKIRLIFEDLQAEGIAPEALAAVYAPVGIDIGSQTVPEIAVSILAELVAHRNLGGKVPGRPQAVELPA